MARFTVYIPDELWAACKQANTDLNTSSLVQEALLAWLQDHDPTMYTVLTMPFAQRLDILTKAVRAQL